MHLPRGLIVNIHLGYWFCQSANNSREIRLTPFRFARNASDSSQNYINHVRTQWHRNTKIFMRYQVVEKLPLR